MRFKKKILAVSSGGGHWVELLRLRPVLEKHNVIYVSVLNCYHSDVKENQFYLINDATRWDWLGLIKMAFALIRILHREKPDIVISTGAAPGYFGLRFAKLLTNAQTIWIESLAMVKAQSLSGRKVGPYADLWLTQWNYPNMQEKLKYRGNVL